LKFTKAAAEAAALLFQSDYRGEQFGR